MPADVLALFDLDHTLLPHDSDEQWVAFLIEAGVLDGRHYEAANHELIARFNRGEAGAAEFAEFYLSTLKDCNVAELERRREHFIASRVRPRIAPAARALVDRHLGAGDVVVLTTAVIHFLAQPIAAEFGIADVIATDGEILEGRYTGRVSGIANMREGKVERLLEWLASRGSRLADFRETWAYCDSQNDLPLLAHVSRPVAVNADPVLAAHARHMGWQVLQIG